MLFFAPENVWAQLSKGQLFPAKNDTLPYRHVRFEWPPVWEATAYHLRIWEKSDYGTDTPLSASHHLVHTTPHAGLVVREGLEFGKTYTWEVQPVIEGITGEASPSQSFYIRQAPRIDPAVYRHRIVVDQLADQRFCFFIDKPGVLIDHKGQPVWYVPADSIKRVFNLQLLANGHIAYLRPTGGKSGNEGLVFEEITPEGMLVWQAPDDGTVSGHDREYFHHDFQYRTNGNYLIAGDQYLDREVAGSDYPIRARFGTLIEYNPAGKVVWSWKSADYLKNEDVFAEGLKDNPVHMNGFWFDETRQQIFISFRYIDRVVQISYPDKKVLNSFGRRMPSGEAFSGNGAFLRQHSPNVSGNQLYLYDNRTGRGADSISSIVVLSIPPTPRDSGRILRRHPLHFGSRRESWSESKGDVDLMPEEQILACMGSIPRTLVWQKDQGIVWQAEHEFRNDPTQDWIGIEANYRAHWTPGLHPIHFAPAASLLKRYRNKSRIQVLVTNLGTSADQYEILLHTQAAAKMLGKLAVDVDQSGTLEITLKQKLARSNTNWLLEIRSTQQPSFTRFVHIPTE